MKLLNESTVDWQIACDRVAEQLLEETGVHGPPFDMTVLAERCQLLVAYDATQPGRGRLKRMGGRTAILVRPEERPERLQWTIAHEIGEAYAYRVFEAVDAGPEDVPPALREQVASELASRLLLPGETFLRDARFLDGDVLLLKRNYSTASHELILLNLLRLPTLSLVTVFDHGALTRRRGNGQIAPPRLLPIERAVWANVHASGGADEACNESVRVQGWAVHEPGWKRELLRTTVADEFDAGASIDDDWI